jgi:hypothetical protein
MSNDKQRESHRLSAIQSAWAFLTRRGPHGCSPVKLDWTDWNEAVRKATGDIRQPGAEQQSAGTEKQGRASWAAFLDDRHKALILAWLSGVEAGELDLLAALADPLTADRQVLKLHGRKLAWIEPLDGALLAQPIELDFGFGVQCMHFVMAELGRPQSRKERDANDDPTLLQSGNVTAHVSPVRWRYFVDGVPLGRRQAIRICGPFEISQYRSPNSN